MGRWHVGTASLQPPHGAAEHSIEKFPVYRHALFHAGLDNGYSSYPKLCGSQVHKDPLCPQSVQIGEEMKPIKYVMIQRCLPIIFDGFNHSDLKILGKEITSAGFIVFDKDGKVQTYGESTTLNMIPDKNDASIIQTFFDKGRDNL